VSGQVYEQFLGLSACGPPAAARAGHAQAGKVIRLTAGHQAKVEEKPEVRKAGGVHYTLQYIVNYIVKNIMGKLVEDETSADGRQTKTALATYA